MTQSYVKSPYANRNEKAKWQCSQKRHQKFDYTAIAERLRTDAVNARESA